MMHMYLVNGLVVDADEVTRGWVDLESLVKGEGSFCSVGGYVKDVSQRQS